MKKIAILSEGCYAHIDFDLIPMLLNNFSVGWFCFFNHKVQQSAVKDFTNRSETIKTTISNSIVLSSRMRSFKTLKQLNEFLKPIKEWNPDVIYVNADGFPYLPFLLRLKFSNKLVIGAIHDVKAHSNSDFITKFYKPLLPYFYKYRNTLSLYSYNLLTKKLKSNKNIFCCKHPFTNFGNFTKKEHKKFTVLFFGTLSRYKGLDLLIDAGQKAFYKNENICIKICGKGELDNQVSSLASNSAFNIINRRIDDSEIPEILSDVDCLALPYKDASQSGPMMIALNYHIPVIANKIEAFKEFGEKFSEIHLIDNDCDSWAKKLVELAKNFPNSFEKIDSYVKEIENERESIKNSWIEMFQKVS